MLNLNDNNLRWILKDSQTNGAVMNLTEKSDDDHLQKRNSSKDFYGCKIKYKRNNLIKNDGETNNLTSFYSLNQENQLTSYPIEKIRKSDTSTQLKRWHIIDNNNNLKHFNLHSICTLNKFDKNYSNALMMNPNNDVLKGVARSQSFITEPIIPSGQSTLGKNICVTESWREINHVDKIKLTALLFQVNSLTNKIMLPFVNLHALANPFFQIPIQVCRMANNINLNMAEVLCRKRTEVAIISWMTITQNIKINRNNNTY